MQLGERVAEDAIFMESDSSRSNLGMRQTYTNSHYVQWCNWKFQFSGSWPEEKLPRESAANHHHH